MPVNRKYWDRRIAQLFRQDDFSPADLSAVAAYLRGEFDRKPRRGRRPLGPFTSFAKDVKLEIVRQFKRELGCTLKEAIKIALEFSDIADPDGRIAKSLWHDWRR
jgi:phage terminase small subunit